MPITVSHSPSYASYGSALYGAGQGQEEYERLAAMLQLMAPLGQREKESKRDQQLREKALAQQQEDSLKQLALKAAEIEGQYAYHRANSNPDNIYGVRGSLTARMGLPGGMYSQDSANRPFGGGGISSRMF